MDSWALEQSLALGYFGTLAVLWLSWTVKANSGTGRRSDAASEANRRYRYTPWR